MTDNGNKSSFKKWTTAIFAVILILLLLSMTIIVVIDPLFHYHAPLDGLAYPLEDERYINDGILRHFDYNAVIAGNSMTENFKTSEANRLFNANFAKVPIAGAYYKEVNDELTRAFDYNDGIKYVIRALDLHCLCYDKDEYTPGYDIPDYLYDDNIFNDVSYVLNKEMILKALNVLEYTAEGNETTSFDDYASWETEGGAEVVLGKYQIIGRMDTQRALTDAERETAAANIIQNVTTLAAAHPETTFLYYFPPVSIAYWDEVSAAGELEMRLEAIELAAEMMLEYPNIRIFMFTNDFDTISNLNYYRDQLHYSSDISSLLLEYMANGDYLVTEDNLDTLMSEARDFYLNYDYEALHSTES